MKAPPNVEQHLLNTVPKGFKKVQGTGNLEEVKKYLDNAYREHKTEYVATFDQAFDKE